MSRADRFNHDTRPEEPNTGIGGPEDTSKNTVPKNPNTGTGKPKAAAKPGNGQVPAIVVESTDGARALQSVAGITPHTNPFQELNLIFVDFFVISLLTYRALLVFAS